MTQFVERIPTWALNYLINDDATGLNDEDIDQVDTFITENKVSIVSPIQDDNGNYDEYFSHYPCFGLASDVIDCNIICSF